MVTGLDKGHKTTPNTLKPKPSNNKGKQTNHNKFVRDIIREVAGFSPYEKVFFKKKFREIDFEFHEIFSQKLISRKNVTIYIYFFMMNAIVALTPLIGNPPCI